MTQRYSVSEEKRKQYAGIYLLEYMINKPIAFDVLMRDEEADLEPILIWLMSKEYVTIKDECQYIPTEKGREVLSNFMKRYSEYLNIFDIYCAVDLASGEFAFADYFDYEDASAWKHYLSDERWEDLRVAVASYKKMDPVEIVFMSFISEGRFGRNAVGWQFDLLLGSVWDDIVAICNNALQWEQLGYEETSAESVIEDVIVQGAELIIELHQREADLTKTIQHYDNDDADNSDKTPQQYVEQVEFEHYPVDYYYSYRDPFYISPLWLLLLI